MKLAKAGLLGVYGWAIAGSLAPDAVPGGELAQKVLIGLVGAHVVETALAMKDIRQLDEPAGGHIAQMMVFGMFHWKEIKAKLAEQDALEA